MAKAPSHQTDALDAQLVLRAQDGDRDAFVQLFRRHAGPAWRLALAVGGSAEVAAQSVATGFTLSLIRLQRRTTTLTVPFRHLVTRASGEAAATASRRDDTTADPAPNELAEAFFALPERWRAALWLTLVEGGTPAQAAPIVGLSEEGTASLVDRATAGLHTRFARSTPLGAYFLRDLSDAAPKLRAIVRPIPITLEADAVRQWAAWQQTISKKKRHGLAAVFPLRPWTERAVSAAAAAVFAAGLAAAINIGASDAQHEAPMLASPVRRVETAASVQDATVRSTHSNSPYGTPVYLPYTTNRHSVSGTSDTARNVAAKNATANTGTTDTSNTSTTSSDSPAPAPAPSPSASDPPVADQSGGTTPSASAGTTVAGTPVAVGASTAGVGVTVGDTTIGSTTTTTAPSSGTTVTVDPGGGLPPIGVSLP